LREHFPLAIYYDLLKSDVFLRFTASPYLLREELLALSGGRPQRAAYVVAMEPRPRRIKQNGLTFDILPVQQFLELLWNGKIIF